MKEAADFLTGFARCVSTMALYDAGHPSRERVVEDALHKLTRLQEVAPTPHFTFLGGEVLLDNRPLRALRQWDWGERMARHGIQRVEFRGPITRGDFDIFLDEIHARVGGDGAPTAEVRQGRPTNIRWGSVGVTSDEGVVVPDEERAEIGTATLGYDLQDEISTVDWLHQELRGRNQLHMLEAEAIVRSLSVAMHGDQEFVLPLLRLKQFDQYTTTHAMNVSVLAMSLAEFIGLGPREIRAFGISGLLHDLGKVTIPEEILNKPGRLTDDEREVMNRHTTEGARIILETEDHLDLAAVVAYEHHIKLDGGGYPALRYPRKCHQASDMVHVCDVFDALRTKRPYRDAWDQDRVLGYLEEGAGSEFDPELARAFVQMMRTRSGRIAEIEREDEAVIPAGVVGGGAADPTDRTQPSQESVEPA